MSQDAAATDGAPTVQDAATKAPSKNGYHYWHAHGRECKERGDVAPLPQHVALKQETVVTVEVPKTAIQKYSWCNNTKTVSVYVDFDGVAEDRVSVDFSPSRLDVNVTAADGKPHVLALELSKDIDPAKCSYRLKPNQVVLKLGKANEDETWFDLVKSK